MKSPHVHWDRGAVSRRQRWATLGRAGATVWLTGPPAAGTSTLAAAVERRLLEQRCPAYRLDAGETDLALVADDAPHALDRQHARVIHAADGLLFVEVFVNTPLATRIERDRSGHYRDAIDRALTGARRLTSPYEPSPAPDVEITPEPRLPAAVDLVVAALTR